MTVDLINLDDDTATATATSPASDNSINKMAANHVKPSTAQRDSFSDLTSLMKAKAPYAPIAPLTPRAPPLLSVPNGMRFATRNTSSGNILSPLAKPFKAPESVAAYLQRQELNSPTSVSPPTWPVPTYHKDDDDDDAHSPRTPSPPYTESLLIPGLAPPARFGPINPPTPTDSLQPSYSEYHSSQEPVVRVTKYVWENMGKSLDAARKQKQELEEKLSVLERDIEVLRNIDHDAGAQLGKLRYQNEVNKVQKSSMGQALVQKEMELKKQQLDIDELFRKLGEAESKLEELSGVSGELEYSRRVKTSMELAHEHALYDLAASKDRELESVRADVQKFEQKVEHLTRERDVASRAQVNSGDHQSRAKNLADTLVTREKVISGLRLQLVGEQLRVSELEDQVEKLKKDSRKEDIDDLKAKLREKTSQCDSQRHKLKSAEAHLKLSQERVMKLANNGESLQGAAHLVRPNEKTRLPKTVYSCSECYATNLECDSSTVCRSCSERDTPCARWRCSVKHKLGECTLAPCKFPHDSQGWLVLQAERPQW